jgi:hypothetical protein
MTRQYIYEIDGVSLDRTSVAFAIAFALLAARSTGAEAAAPVAAKDQWSRIGQLNCRIGKAADQYKDNKIECVLEMPGRPVEYYWGAVDRVDLKQSNYVDLSWTVVEKSAPSTEESIIGNHKYAVERYSMGALAGCYVTTTQSILEGGSYPPHQLRAINGSRNGGLVRQMVLRQGLSGGKPAPASFVSTCIYYPDQPKSYQPAPGAIQLLPK